jgi:hypothetical protein
MAKTMQPERKPKLEPAPKFERRFRGMLGQRHVVPLALRAGGQALRAGGQALRAGGQALREGGQALREGGSLIGSRLSSTFDNFIHDIHNFEASNYLQKVNRKTSGRAAARSQGAAPPRGTAAPPPERREEAVMGMAMQPEHEPVERRLEEMLDQPHAVPLVLHVYGSLIAIKDLSPSIEQFREQKRMLERIDSEWPSVLVNFRDRPELGERWIPLDLRDGIQHLETRDSVERRLLSQEIQYDIIKRAQQANLNTDTVRRDEVTRNFRDILLDIITGRVSHPARPPADEPPSEEFTVTTDENNQEVLFAAAYFISTKQGFGISSPATRRLPWGRYMFGIKKRGEPVFEDTPWTVPDVLSIHLRV